MLINRLTALAAACACAFCFTGCEKGGESSAADGGVTSVQTESPAPTAPVELKDYSFPEFMAETSPSEMLTNVTEVSFDPAKAELKLDESPLSQYDCDTCLFGEFYTYTDQGFVGIVNSNGSEVIKADKYIKAEPVSNSLVRLDYPADSGESSDLILLEEGYGTMVDESFDEENIQIASIYDDVNAVDQYRLIVNDRVDEAHLWDKLERVSLASVATKKSFPAIYRGTIGGRNYYITFDEYYNMTVYEAAYAFVRLKVSDEYGECYVLDGDDYSELGKMIESFGSENQSAKPSKDETLDYIQITFGLGTEEQTVVTISADGFCFRDKTSTKDEPPVKYFSTYSKETFVDLVNWVSDVLSEEYADIAPAEPAEQAP